MRALVFLLLFFGALTPLALSGTAATASGPNSFGPYPFRQIRLLFDGGIRYQDGSANNLRHQDWGQSNTPYLRSAPTNYGDGKSSIAALPNSRYISNRIFNDEAQNVFSENGVTQWAWTWGQFMDHTIGLAAAGTTSAPIAFDQNDPLEEFTNDFGVIGLTRDAFAPGTGVNKPAQQINTVSSTIDAWNVYGGTYDRLEWLREGPYDGNMANNGAHLMLTADGFLPKVGDRGNSGAAPTMALMGRLMGDPTDAVVAGDVRANENIALTAVQTLFAREHNRIVDALPKVLTEEIKFQIARAEVIAEEQYITYNEFLPDLGVTLDRYRGYDRNVNPTITNEFATVAYRAHSMIHGEFEMEAEGDRYTPEQIEWLEHQGLEVEQNGDEMEVVVPLNIAFGNPDLVPGIGLDEVLESLGAESQYKNDEMMDNQLRSVLFQIPGPGVTDPSQCLDGPDLHNCFSVVQDLAAIDIERSRDHGIASYNDLRKAYGLAPKTSFKAITGESTELFPNDPEINAADPINDPSILDIMQVKDINGNIIPAGTEAGATSIIRRTTLAARLKAIYGDVSKVDAFVGMSAEKHVKGTEFGELQLAIWKKQFTALRDGDRYFYKNYGALDNIKRLFGISYEHSLSEIIQMNTGVEADEISADVFKVAPAAPTAPTVPTPTPRPTGHPHNHSTDGDVVPAVANIGTDVDVPRLRETAGV